MTMAFVFPGQGSAAVGMGAELFEREPTVGAYFERVSALLGRDLKAITLAGPEETLVVFRERQGGKTIKHDYCLSNAPSDTSLREFARVLGAEHRIEECLRRAKGEAGLAQYQVRTWNGWHHHQTLTLLATWFLTQEKRRGEKIGPLSFRAGAALDHRTIAA